MADSTVNDPHRKREIEGLDGPLENIISKGEMMTASCGWQYCKLACYCICGTWSVVHVMEHE
jgi:hypothetical protein